jgi:hypothetical protein
MVYDVRTHPTARCIVCNHSLYRIKGERCPECGTPFDPHSPQRMFTPPPGTVRGWIVLLVGLVLVVLFGFVFVPMFFSWFGA